MKDWTIRRRILLSFTVVLLLMSAMGGITLVLLENIEKETGSMQKDSLPGVEYSSRLLAEFSAVHALALRHVFLINSADKAAVDKDEFLLRANRASVEDLAKKYEATIFQQKDRENFETFKTELAAYTQIQEQLLKLGAALQKKDAEALATGQLHRGAEKAHGAIQTIVDFNTASADKSVAGIAAAVTSARTGIVVTFMAALVLAAVCGYLLLKAVTAPLEGLLATVKVMGQGDFSQRVAFDRRDEFGVLAQGFNSMTDNLVALVEQVQKSGIQVNTSVTEIAATAKEQQATASEVAATTSEIGATSKEISATSRELVKTMNEVSGVAEQTATLAGSGQTSLARMEETMQKVMEAAGLINAKLAVLSEKAGNINQVVTTITKVADQTNLLSLNAAIEAEKAGEYGRGFSVVATEIRRLADQTAVATFDIEQMVREIQSAVSAGVMGMEKFSEEVRHGMQEVQQVGEQLSQIIHQVQALAPRFEVVGEGMQAQATGAEQISEALTQLSEASQQTVESLRQSTETIGELNHVVSGLRDSVSRFRLQA